MSNVLIVDLELQELMRYLRYYKEPCRRSTFDTSFVISYCHYILPAAIRDWQRAQRVISVMKLMRLNSFSIKLDIAHINQIDDDTMAGS